MASDRDRRALPRSWSLTHQGSEKKHGGKRYLQPAVSLDEPHIEGTTG
jgi:hypothetical protein